MTDQSPTREELIERRRATILAFDDFLNEPPRSLSIEPPELRDYRHEAYRKWEAIVSLLRSDSQRIAELEGRLKDGASSAESAASVASDLTDQDRGAPLEGQG